MIPSSVSGRPVLPKLICPGTWKEGAMWCMPKLCRGIIAAWVSRWESSCNSTNCGKRLRVDRRLFRCAKSNAGGPSSEPPAAVCRVMLWSHCWAAGIPFPWWLSQFTTGHHDGKFWNFLLWKTLSVRQYWDRWTMVWHQIVCSSLLALWRILVLTYLVFIVRSVCFQWVRSDYSPSHT